MTRRRSKSLASSRTIWLNTLAVLLGFYAQQSPEVAAKLPDSNTALVLLGAANAALRLKTGQPLELNTSAADDPE